MPPKPPMDFVRRQPAPPKINKFVDLNTDFGQTPDRHFFEGKEKTLLNYVSSVNIPCAVADSDPAQVLRDIQTAKKNLCAVGAHIAYPDPKHFGNKSMEISDEELTGWILMQLGGFQAFCRASHLEVEHIRPHGAMYADFILNEERALIIAQAIKRFDPWAIVILPVSPITTKIKAELELNVAQEVYLGKRVNREGVLIPERFGETLHPQGVIEQVRQLLTDGQLTAEDGTLVKVDCRSMHISPKIQGNMMIAERVNAMMGRPLSLSLSDAGKSGWL